MAGAGSTEDSRWPIDLGDHHLKFEVSDFIRRPEWYGMVVYITLWICVVMFDAGQRQGR
jgi:hypothetical protein